jgi:hypothetical protein
MLDFVNSLFISTCVFYLFTILKECENFSGFVGQTSDR